MDVPAQFARWWSPFQVCGGDSWVSSGSGGVCHARDPIQPLIRRPEAGRSWRAELETGVVEPFQQRRAFGEAGPEGGDPFDEEVIP